MQPSELPPDPSNVQEYSTVEGLSYGHIITVLGRPKDGQWVYRTSWGVVALRPVTDDIETATSWKLYGEPDPLTSSPKAADFFANYLEGTRL